MSDGAVTRTLAEIGATATKAARGAGCPWGLAEETGMATRLLEAHGLPGVAALARLFDTPRACACAGCDGAAACGLASMAEIADRAHRIAEGAEIRLDHVAAPVLLAGPLLLAARRLGVAFEVTWPGARLVCSREGLAASTEIDVCPATAKDIRVSCTKDIGLPVPQNIGSREVPADSWARLQALAEATMVPESEGSRARGAGPAGDD